jgi:hypothetical protein
MSCKLRPKLLAQRCCNAYATAKQAKVPVVVIAATVVEMAAVGVLHQMAVAIEAAMVAVEMAWVALADTAHAAKLQTVVTVPIAGHAKTAAVSFNLHAPKAIAQPTHLAKAAAVALVWVNPQALPTNPAHPARLQDNLTPCVPASI